MRLAWLTVASALLVAGCPGEDPPPPDGGVDTGPPEWQAVIEGLDGALLSISGTSERDVWAVGGALGNGGEALVLRFDGATWSRAKPGGAETFWWVHGTGPTDVWLVGERGRATHWDGAKFEERASGTTATLFGVWAAAPNDAWAVGGSPDDPSAPNDVVLHWDGAAWAPVALPAPTKSALFKVWGASPDDLYVVGEAGVVWHRTGGAWAREAEGVATGRLTTVGGCTDGRVFAVGGRDLLVKTAGVWARSDALLVNDVNGVACAPPGAPAQPWGSAVVVGGGSLKLRLVDGAWVSDFGSKPFSDLHGAWVDPTGAFWAVGGNFSAAARPGASRGGVVARFGPGTVPGTLAP